ncbi:hypothetical protein SMX40_003378 [Cronobacter turicensis]|nr:hypothetical protein [Cronobacter turicensis]ELY3628163.1 hypothetical protein [Cronobacter turicensis]
MAGLQCWDASGRLVVDLGDYMVRHRGRITVKAPGGVNQFDVAIPGATASGSFAAITTTLMQTRIWGTSCYDGGVTVFFVPGTSFADTLTIDLYDFI